MSTFREFAKRATALGQEYNNAKAAARRPSPDLTPEASSDRIARDLEGVQAKYAGRFEALAGDVRASRDAAIAGAAKVRPTLISTDTAALVRTEQAWTHNIKPLLERGLTLEQVLQTADVGGALGAERFAAGWMRQHANPENRTDFDSLVRHVVAGAFARQAPSEADALAIQQGESAEREFAALRDVISYAKNGQALQAALAAAYADVAPTEDGNG